VVSTVIFCYDIISYGTTVAYAARRWTKLGHAAHTNTITGTPVPCNGVTVCLQSAPWGSQRCVKESICLYLVTYYVDKLQNINVSEEPSASIVRADVRHLTFVRNIGALYQNIRSHIPESKIVTVTAVKISNITWLIHVCHFSVASKRDGCWEATPQQERLCRVRASWWHQHDSLDTP
jgi:hypothetical protein